MVSKFQASLDNSPVARQLLTARGSDSASASGDTWEGRVSAGRAVAPWPRQHGGRGSWQGSYWSDGGSGGGGGWSDASQDAGRWGGGYRSDQYRRWRGDPHPWRRGRQDAVVESVLTGRFGGGFDSSTFGEGRPHDHAWQQVDCHFQRKQISARDQPLELRLDGMRSVLEANMLEDYRNTVILKCIHHGS